jgi:replication-associated recombination protein RarA
MNVTRYAPVLRPLRALAKIVRFSPPTNAMLVTRLRAICDEEGLGADAKNLTMLAEVAEGDLRSCLNTLQVRRGPYVTRGAADLNELCVGSSSNVAVVWWTRRRFDLLSSG